MTSLPLRAQLGIVAAVYAAVVAVSGVLVFMRYMQYVRHPEDVAAAGGMYAFGDTMLAVFIVCMLLVPTFFLAMVVRQSESLSIRYAKAMLSVSVTLPLSAGLIALPAIGQSQSIFGEICLERIFAAPVVFAGLVMSRLLAKFDRGKRLTLYAILIEALTLAVMIALLTLPLKIHGR
ncbi:MAG TPA: hypothetical protein VMT67_06325 [Terriglobales bacterium]|nr:hypothetical protein [Terriglobales bacterium]